MMEQTPGSMPLSLLQELCAQETQNYRSTRRSDEQYCLEIFRRAVVEAANEAWMALQEQFRENVLYWLRRHSRRVEALRVDTEQNYVDDTVKRLWQWSHNQRAELSALVEFNRQTGFKSLPGALKFLHD